MWNCSKLTIKTPERVNAGWVISLIPSPVSSIKFDDFDWIFVHREIFLRDVGKIGSWLVSSFKEVPYNCSAHRSAHFFIIARSSHGNKERKQPQIICVRYSCSVSMIDIVKKYMWRKIHELNAMIGTSDDS